MQTSPDTASSSGSPTLPPGEPRRGSRGSGVAHAALVAELQSRWPEHRIAPSLGRVQALCDLLGNPERSAPVIQVAGTNGKGSTAIIIDALLRSTGLRTGRVASPHLEDLTERICLDGVPISREAFADLYAEVKPYIEMVDAQAIDGVAMTFFEVMTGLAFAAFADAPVDVMVLEVGLGGRWDATNVADADVAVICPIDLDHTHILGSTIAEIAAEKAGIIKAGSTVVIAGQSREAAQVLLARCAEVGAEPLLEGPGFGLLDRELAVGGQVLRIDAAEGPVGDLHLPLHGRHMAENAALAVAAVEAFLGGQALTGEVISDAFADVVAPARLEVLRRSPTVVLDTAHNPHAVRSTLEAVEESFNFQPLVGVVAMMADKAVDEVVALLGERLSHVVVTTASSTSRALPVDDLADVVEGVMGADRVDRAATMAVALETAIRLADEAGPGAGVLIVGSVIAAGEARQILGPPRGLGLATATLDPADPTNGGDGWDDAPDHRDVDEEDDW